MDKTELTPEETSELVHFLKSWGIDDPVLLAEMTDHYSDKALERMSEGKSLEEVLDSWRTKAMFRTLRQIQKKYEDYSKKHWRRKHWLIFKELITPRNVLVFLLAFVAIYFTLRMKYISGIFFGLFIIKAIAVVGFVLYHYTFNKLKRRLYTPTSIGLLWIGNYIVISNFIRNFEFPDPVVNTASGAIILTSVICLIFISDIVFFRVWNYISQTTGHITREMLTEWEVPKPD